MAKYAVVTEKVATESGSVNVATVQAAGKRRESKNVQLFDDLNEAKDAAHTLNVATRDVVANAILMTRKLRAHNIANDEAPGTNLQGASWESMLGTQGTRS